VGLVAVLAALDVLSLFGLHNPERDKKTAGYLIVGVYLRRHIAPLMRQFMEFTFAKSKRPSERFWWLRNRSPRIRSPLMKGHAPALFTAAMTLIDTVDGFLMVGAFELALEEPIRLLH
jgi:hypothetical protein